MIIDSQADLEALKKIGRIVADCLQLMGKSLEIGMTTLELDSIGERYLAKMGARSAPQLVYKFPGATCISVNHCVAHGIPSAYALKPSDLVNIDVSAELDGYFADTGASFIVPPSKPIQEFVCSSTRQALESAISEARASRPLNTIGKMIEKVAEKSGLTIIENLGSHGVGRSLHEEPGSIPSFYDPDDKRILQEGLVITIEPFLSNGAWCVKEDKDGWSLMIPKKYISAQYEHTIVITKNKPVITTLMSC